MVAVDNSLTSVRHSQASFNEVSLCRYGYYLTPALLRQIHVDITCYKAPELIEIIMANDYLNGPLMILHQTLLWAFQVEHIGSFVPLRDLSVCLN